MKEKKTSPVLFIFFTLLIDVIGIGIIIPVMPKLIKELISGDLSKASLYSGLLMLSYSLMQFIFAPIVGNLSDKYGRRPILLMSLFGFAIDYLFLAWAPAIGWLFLGRILAGITGASFTTASAYIADVSTPDKRAQNFGLIGVAFGLGFIIGPILGGVVSAKFGVRAPFIAAAALCFINFLYGYFILPESLKKENRRNFEWKRANPFGALFQLKKYPVVYGLIASLICIYLAAHAVQSTWTFITMAKYNWDEKMIGYSLGIVGLLVAIVQGGLIRVINPKLGQKRSVYFGLVLYAIGFVLFSIANTGWLLLVFLLPYCLGGICGPALQGIISNQVPANEQGELQGALTSLMSVTSIVGPILMTNLFSYFTSPAAPVYFAGAPFIMGAILTVASLFFAMRSLNGYVHLNETEA